MQILSFDLKRLRAEPGSWIALLGIIGALLLLLAELWPAPRSAAQSAVSQPSADTVIFSYEQQLEQRLGQLIMQVNGAGNTQVMVTVISGEETIYARDIQQKGEGDTTETHVLTGDGSALPETTLSPVICGVAVVCEGGGDVATVARITEMLSALLDLPTNRISVQKMK